MANDSQFSDFINELSIQTKMENIWSNTCGSWQNCNETTLQAFLEECLDYNLDPQFCMNWIEQHHDQIPNWYTISNTSLNWINQHTSSGSPLSITEQELS